MIMPGFSNARVPMQVRLFVAVAVSLALFLPLSDVILPFAESTPDMLFKTIASELLTGALIGVLARLYLLALEFMGDYQRDRLFRFQHIALASARTPVAGWP